MKELFTTIGLICFLNGLLISQDYSFMGSSVNKVDALTNEVLGSGVLLYEVMLSPDEVKKVEIRYASDTQILNQQGNPVTVERIMDFYYPTPNIKFMSGDNEILSLPVVVMLHSGQGDRNSVAPQAKDLAQRGYTVLVPTYRSDRSVVNYCIGFKNTVYGMVQDLRATLRHFAKAHDDAMTFSIETIFDMHGQEIANFAEGLKESRCDANSLFFSGYSGGGSAGFHTATRINQDQFPYYLSDTDPYIITGELGDANLGQKGFLDDVGTSYIDGVPFPISRLKGTISRTVGIEDLSLINFQNHPNPVPTCFIHGTCDKVLPYFQGELVGANELCDARVTYPDGSQDSLIALYGSDPVSKAYSMAGAYAEMVTFCGGGHTSNQCVTEIVNQQIFQFIKRILVGQFTNGQLVDIVYRYVPENYSNQCCQIGDAYVYIEKCSCNDSNPVDVIDLDYIPFNACQFTANCGLLDYCSLTQPVGVDDINISNDYLLKLTIKGQDAIIEYTNPISQATDIEIFDAQGRVIFQTIVRSVQGINYFTLPAEIPKDQLQIIRVGKMSSLKYVIH